MLLVGYNMGRRRGSEPWLLPVRCLLPVWCLGSLCLMQLVVLAELSAGGVERRWSALLARGMGCPGSVLRVQTVRRARELEQSHKRQQFAIKNLLDGKR